MPYDPQIPLFEYITNALPTMRRSERRVAELVADNPTFIVDSTMATVAEAAGVSEPTVMRFCTNLSFDGFQQFKMALAKTLALGLPATLSTITAADTVAALSTKTFDHTLSSLDRARRYLDAECVEAAVDIILRADSMVFAGMGASAIIAMDAEQKAPLFGIPCSMPSDPHQQFMAATMVDSGTAVVAISNTGATRSVVQIARAAKQSGGMVIAITGEEDGPLAAECDVVIVLKTFEDTDTYTPTVSRLAALVVIDILATAVSLRRGPEHANRLARMKEQLTNFRRSDPN